MCTALSTKSIEEQLPWKTLVTFYRRSTGYQGSLNEFISREALTLHTDMKGTDVKHLYPGPEVTLNIILSNRNFQINSISLNVMSKQKLHFINGLVDFNRT